jgi:MFS family permease
MQSFSANPDVEKSLQHSLKDGVAFAVMTGAGETYLSAFALFLRASTAQIGLLASLPPLLGSLAMLVSAWLGHYTGHRKMIVLTGAALQAFTWLPMLVLPLAIPDAALPILIGCVIIYHCCSGLAVPQWTSLMGDLVPERRRGRFFGLRTRLITAISFAALIGGGLLLQVTTNMGNTVTGFVLLFALAGFARLISVYHLSRMLDPAQSVTTSQLDNNRNWFTYLRQSNAVRFSIFFALMSFAASISAPFFTVYLLRDLQFSYIEFTAVISTAILAQFLTLARWGRISDVFGNRRVLSSTGIAVAIVPLCWLVTPQLWYLVMIQVVSGFVWAGFNLSASNFIYDLVKPGRRAAYMAAHNVLASIGVFCGALLGGVLGAMLPVEIELFGATYSWISPLYGLFLLSAIARGMVVATLLPYLREVRPVPPISHRQLIFRVMRINALAGAVFGIVGPRNRK